MTTSNKFGKLENEYFKQYSFILLENGTAIYTDVPETWFENGYKLLNESAKPEPKEGYYFVESYTEVGNEVIMSYTEVENQPNHFGL